MKNVRGVAPASFRSTQNGLEQPRIYLPDQFNSQLYYEPRKRLFNASWFDGGAKGNVHELCCDTYMKTQSANDIPGPVSNTSLGRAHTFMEYCAAGMNRE